MQDTCMHMCARGEGPTCYALLPSVPRTLQGPAAAAGPSHSTGHNPLSATHWTVAAAAAAAAAAATAPAAAAPVADAAAAAAAEGEADTVPVAIARWSAAAGQGCEASPAASSP